MILIDRPSLFFEYRAGVALGVTNFCGALLSYPLLLVGTRLAADTRGKLEYFNGKSNPSVDEERFS